MKNQWKFPGEVSHLYHLIHDKDRPKWGKVRTPRGTGTLISAMSGPKGCRVLLDREREYGKYKVGEPWKITRDFDAKDVREA